MEQKANETGQWDKYLNANMQSSLSGRRRRQSGLNFFEM